MKSLNSTGAPSRKPLRCANDAIGLRVIDSVPTTSAVCVYPSFIWSAAWRNSSKPVPQIRCTLSAVTCCGTPAYKPIWRAIKYWKQSPAAMFPVRTEPMSHAATPLRASASRATLMPMSVGDTAARPVQ